MNTQPHSISNQPRLGDLLDLAQQLRRDADASGASLRHRDRRIGQELAGLKHRPVPQLLAWLAQVRRQNDELRDEFRGDRVNVLHRLGLLILGVAGLLAGWAAAAVVFRYDGTHPVNVIHVLAVFVLLQLVTLLGFGISLLPPSVTRFLPGLSTVQDALGLLSPGKLQRFLTRYLPQSYRETVASLLGRGRAHYRLYATLDRWVVAHSSQIFAVMFNLGAVVSALYLVVFSDLAFSWSTTLQLEPAGMQGWTDALSTPWSAFYADARPSLELIEDTRYFRLKEGVFPQASSPAGLGGWWPFLVMCMVVYGLLPRILTWLLARFRLRATLRRIFLRFPGSSDLRDRLNSELVETRAEEPETGQAGDMTAAHETTRDASLGGQSALVINWSAAAPDPDQFRAWVADAAEVTVTAWQEAGGAGSLADDRRVMQTAAGATGSGTAGTASDAPGDAASANPGLMILVKAWEPPMKDFLDFLRELREALPSDRLIHVLPLGRSAAGRVTAAEAHQRDLWQNVLARLGDPWLSCSRLGGEDA